jgi:hypothetical protein
MNDSPDSRPSNSVKPPWPRMRDLPEAERASFTEWLYGSAAPWIDGLPQSEQDAFYPWDYSAWRRNVKIIKAKKFDAKKTEND